MTSNPPIVTRAKDELPTVLACSSCDVTWREQPGAPCWFCGRTGYVMSPERRVVE